MTIIVPDEVKKTLNDFETSTKPFRDSQLHDALVKSFKVTKETPQELKNGWWVEHAAFHFMQNSAGECSEWGTHFGPMARIGENKIPDIKEIDPEVISYWKKRACETKHPILCARYSDLVWEFTYPVTSQKPEIIHAQTAIDSYISSTEQVDEETQMQARYYLERALELAISLGDVPRVQSVKKAMFRLHAQIAKPYKIGSSSFLFDSLYGQKKIKLSEKEKEQIITSLQQILQETSDPTVKERFDPWAAQAAADRLEEHFRKMGQIKEARDSILTAGKAFEAIAKEADSLLAMAWHQDVYERYKERGLKDDAERVQLQSKAKGVHVKDAMKEVVGTVEISREELESIFSELTSGNLQSALNKTVILFVPKVEKVRQHQESLAKEHPFQALIGVKIIGEGQFIAQAGSMEDDPEGRLKLELSQCISISTIFLSAVLEKIKTHYSFTVEDLVNHFYESPLLDLERKDLISEGVSAYLANDHVKAIHLLVPQIEHVFRRLLSLLGRPTNKQNRSAGKGTMQEKNINDVLSDPAIDKVFTKDMKLYFLVSLADQRGLNIRNRVSHGLMLKNDFNQRISDLLINILLCLSTIREHPTVDDNPQCQARAEPHEI